MKTLSLRRKAFEQAAMAGLMVTARVALTQRRVRDVVESAEQIARVLRWTSPLGENEDTLVRGRALAYTWSSRIPGCSCLHRAISTQVWLAAFRLESEIKLGLRKRDRIEGHAWLEVKLPDAATLLFVDDEDGYHTELILDVPTPD